MAEIVNTTNMDRAETEVGWVIGRRDAYPVSMVPWFDVFKGMVKYVPDTQGPNVNESTYSATLYGNPVAVDILNQVRNILARAEWNGTLLPEQQNRLDSLWSEAEQLAGRAKPISNSSHDLDAQASNF